ncbi:MAG: hypothetical protein HC922_10910, partial [Leptolyngbyaceae cyanobacterium SM2_3_12]|nr:hypothetical protein [Leptolyngbyaceae cyanobacterium SM2_3_12]
MNTTAVLTKISALATGVASLTLAWAGSALAMTLTFDDLPDITTPIGTELTAPIPNSSGGYGGLAWSNFFYLDARNYFANPSGFE